MFTNFQTTLKHAVRCTGVGLHSGAPVRMTLEPAPADTGIVFRRRDKAAVEAEISANYGNVSGTQLGTTLVNAAGVSVATVEHLMAALWGCGIDNVVVDLDGPEVPIMDGSSSPFVFLVECAGKQVLDRPRRYIEVLREVTVSDGAAFATLKPADTFSVSMEIDFRNPVVARQKAAFDFRDASFKRELCRARTFGFEEEVEYLRSKGLARGGSLQNAIVVGQEKILNEEGLRYEDEFVRHKVLDCVGDIYLAGAPIKGHIEAFRTGHGLNNRLLRQFFVDTSAWRMIQPVPVVPQVSVAAAAGSA